MWYNTSPQRILRMTLPGDDKDVAYSDSRSVRRTLSRSRYYSSDIGAAASSGAARSDLRGRQTTTILQTTAFLPGCGCHGGSSDSDSQLRTRRVSGYEGTTGRIACGALRQTQPHRARNLVVLGPADRQRCGEGHRCDGSREERGLGWVRGLLSRWQPFGSDRAPSGGTPRYPRRSAAWAIAGAFGRPARVDRRSCALRRRSLSGAVV